MVNANENDLTALQLAVVRMQQSALEAGERIVLVLEGRDTAGKDGAIRRIVEHLSVRATRVVALPKPSDRERTEWYFQRYTAHLPAAGEFVIFNRSWYNRAGVETVMAFSTDAEQAAFLRDAPEFERMLVESGIKLIKLWLDISKDEQAKRLEARRSNPLKALKVSALDSVAQEKWDAYSAARDTMLMRTHTPFAPWYCVRANHKRRARRAIIQHLLHQVAPAEIASIVGTPETSVIFPFEAAAMSDGRLAP